MKKVFLFTVLIISLLVFSACGGPDQSSTEKTRVTITESTSMEEKSSSEEQSSSEQSSISSEAKEETTNGSLVNENKGEEQTMETLEKGLYADITMENGGKIIVKLMPEVAPKTVENFQKLANSGFYNGLIFHRVIKDFMIQGGDPSGTGMGGSEETITGEFSANGFENNLSHERGVISMARSRDMNSASSQFFIVHQDSPHLDGQYAAFGKVARGLEVLDDIANTETGAGDKPIVDQVMKTVEVYEVQ